MANVVADTDVTPERGFGRSVGEAGQLGKARDCTFREQAVLEKGDRLLDGLEKAVRFGLDRKVDDLAGRPLDLDQLHNVADQVVGDPIDHAGFGD